MKPLKISPSILAANLLRLEEEVKLITAAGADLLHIDIMDNHFVPNLTFGPDLTKQLKQITNLPLDVHLMVHPVDEMIDKFGKAGADILIIHPESNPNIVRSLQKIKSLSIKAGIAINPGTSFEQIKPLLNFLDVILVMTVNPGFAGQPFLYQTLDKLAEIKNYIVKKSLPISLQVDGGINVGTAKMVVNAGAEILVAGHSIFSTLDYKKAIYDLKKTYYS